MNRKSLYAAVALMAAAASVQSCGGQKQSVDSDTIATESIEAEEVVAEMPDSVFQATVEFFADPANKGNGQDSTSYMQTASGLKYRVLKQGTGASPVATDNVTVHYEGRLLNGFKFDSSYDRGESTTFPLNGVIKGWTEGLQTMKEGGITEFYIPSDLAYGDRETGPIPPNAPLIFKVELIKVN